MTCNVFKQSHRKRRKEERKAIGRPRVRWIDNIRETVQEHQITTIESATKAKTKNLYHPQHSKRYKRK
jgi:hypothetical protein